MSLVQYYRREVTCVPEDAPVREVAAILERDAAGCVVVVGTNGSPTGIITDRDLTLRVVASGRDPERTNAVSIMTHPVVSVADTDSLERAIEQMARHGIRRVLVTEGGRLAGIVSLDDLLAELGGELKDVEGIACKGRERPRATSLAQLREEMEARVQAFRARLERAGEESRQTLLREFDSLREGLRRLLG